jgi:hypothetical protein
LHNRIRSTHSSRLQMAGFVDMKEIQAKSTWGEFRQMDQIDNTIVKRYRPEAFPR